MRKKNWKRLTAFAMSTVMLVSAPMAYAAEGETVKAGMTDYAESRDVDAEGFEIEDGVLKKYTGTATEVVIPEGVTSIGEYAFLNCIGLTSVSIPGSVTYIGDRAFIGCSKLTSVSISEGVTSIGEVAFYGCNGLKSVTIPGSVTSIGYGAFSGCNELESMKVEEGNEVYDSRGNCNAIIKSESNTLVSGCKNTTILESVTIIGGYAFAGHSSLTSVSIPEGVTSIGISAFGGCSGLTSISIPESVTSIEQSAFSGCSGLTSISIPENVTSIEDEMFLFCSGLENVSILGSVTSIGDRAFDSCSRLESISIPRSVTSIGDRAFYNCNELESMKVEEGNEVYDSRGNCNAIIKTESNTLVCGCKNTTIPNSVTSIGEDAFGSCSGLTSISIPESVTSIGQYAFGGCSGLTSVDIPEGVTSIDWGTFSNCSGLESIRIPESVTSIKDNVFYGCSDELTIYGTAGSYAEMYANSHAIDFSTGEMPQPGEKRTISDSDVSLSQTSYAYDGKAKTPAVTVKEGNQTLIEDEDYTVSYEDNVDAGTAKVIVKGKRKYKGTVTKTFTITKADIQESEVKELSKCTIVITPGSYVYDGKAKMPAVTVKDGSKTLTKGVDYTVSYNSNVNTGTAKVIITGKGNYTGSVTKTFTIIVKKGTSYTVGAYKYQVTGTSTVSIMGVSKTNTTKVKIPKTVKIGDRTFKVTAIGKNAFKKDKKVTSVEIGDNVTVIGASAFERCTKLSKVTVGKGVTEIGGNAFKGCAKLGNITVKSTKLKNVGKNALKGIKAKAKIKVPAKNLTAYQRLLRNKGQGKKVKIVK